MGSSVLFGLNSKFSVATENTIWAAPEVTIGSVPDVGTIYHLKQLPGNIGKMLALTGTKVRGMEVVGLGLATHFCQSKFVSELNTELQNSTESDFEDVLNKYHEMSKYEDGKIKTKTSKLKTISEENFQPSDISEIFSKLKSENCSTQLDQLHWAAPLSLKTTCRLFTEISTTDYDQALLQSYKVRCCAISYLHD
jgi:3-hydroxyisobutyryl-CoA hydrolase